ncbi:hypothetical protein NP493_2g24060 [Ridgeia piscesae]|uniref:Uncharacterized protein n=1 Tax=Ridgeia piscesae TaxID=27915 RepID=A0AAD9ULS8_RIDPI|nr:hypothetical protein NP493_2g24060 [Ridgeia piscesae]
MTFFRLLCVFIFVTSQSSAHLRLVYPPARQYALDFLDNARTAPPCGMKAVGFGGEVTDFEEGSSFIVMWQMAYAHNGGYKIQLLEGSTVKHTLTPGKGFVGAKRVT